MSLYPLSSIDQPTRDGPVTIHEPNRVTVHHVPAGGPPTQLVCRVEERDDGTLAVVVAPGVTIETSEVG